MKNPLAEASKADLSFINNIEDLQATTRRLRYTLRKQEDEIRDHLKDFPKQALRASAQSVVPTFLTGKMTGVALSAGAAILGGFLAGRKTKTVEQTLNRSWKQVALLGAAQFLTRLLLKRKPGQAD